MMNLISILCGIVIYGRVCEMGHSSIAAVICGSLMSLLVRYVIETIKKSAEAATSNGQVHNI